MFKEIDIYGNECLLKGSIITNISFLMFRVPLEDTIKDLADGLSFLGRICTKQTHPNVLGLRENKG